VAQEYRPAKLKIGKAHPDPVVETASLAAVEPPDIAYQLHLDDLVAAGDLSALQVCQPLLPMPDRVASCSMSRLPITMSIGEPWVGLRHLLPHKRVGPRWRRIINLP